MKLRKFFLAVIAGAALLTACDKKEVDLGPAKLAVNPTDVSFEAEVSSQDISLVATRDWAVTSLPDWVALSKETGSASSDAQKLSISVTENKGYNRSATIVFSIGFARQAVTINQVGPDGEVDNGDGSKEKPFTVAGAIAYVKELGADVESPKKVFVKGIVSTVETTYEASGTYGNATFNIVDEEGSSEVFKVYQTYYLGNVKWTKGDNNPDIKEKDEVIIYGKIYNYKGNTPETVSKGASFVYSLNGVNRGGDDSGQGGEGTPKGTGTLEDPYNPAGIAAVAAALADNAVSTESYYMKGKISKIAVSKNVDQTFANSGDYGNASFYITDSEDATGEFYIYQTYYLGNRKWVTGDTDIKVGDEVIVYGPVTKYVSSYGTTLETSGKGASYIYSLNGVTDGGTVVPPTPIEHDGLTPETAFTASEANAWIMANLEDKASTETKYYVKGKIQRFYQRDNADQNFTNNSYHQASFFITDDGTENKEKEFEAFQIDYLNDATFDPSKDTDVKVGDEVVVYGPLAKYNTTAETAGKGAAYLYSVNAGGGVPAGDSYVLDKDAIKAAHTEAWSYTSGEKKVKATDGSEWTLVNTYASKDQVTVQMNKGKGSYVLTPAAPEGKVVKKISVVLNKSAKGDGEMGDRPIDILSADGATTLLDDVTGQTLADGLEVPAGNAQVKIICDETNGGAVYITSITVTFTDGEGGGQGGDTPGGDTPAKPVNEGTLESPFTVADALIAAKDADLTGKEYYVKAVVGKDIAIKNGVASFELMDGTTDGKLTVVKAKSFKGAAFDGSEPLDWLDEVILKGTVTEYSTLPALTEGELVKWNGKKTFKDPEKDLSKIIALQKNADAYFEGLVSAVTTKSFVVTDGTNNVYVYQPATMAAIGDKVTVMGTAGNYNGLFQINKNAEVEVISGGNTVTYPDATDITADFDSYAATVNAFVKVLASVAVADSKVTVTVEGATAALQVTDAPDALGLAALDGKKAYITGYFGGSYTKNSATTKYIIATKAEEYSEAPKDIVLTFPDENKDKNKVGSYTTTWTAKIGDNSWSISNFNNNNWGWTNIRCGRKNNDSVASIILNEAPTFAVSEIVVNIASVVADKVNKVKLYISTEADFSTDAGGVILMTPKTGDNILTISSPQANRYYKIEFDCASHTANGFVQVNSVTYKVAE